MQKIALAKNIKAKNKSDIFLKYEKYTKQL